MIEKPRDRMYMMLAAKSIFDLNDILDVITDNEDRRLAADFYGRGVSITRLVNPQRIGYVEPGKTQKDHFIDVRAIMGYAHENRSLFSSIDILTKYLKIVVVIIDLPVRTNQSKKGQPLQRYDGLEILKYRQTNCSNKKEKFASNILAQDIYNDIENKMAVIGLPPFKKEYWGKWWEI